MTLPGVAVPRREDATFSRDLRRMFTRIAGQYSLVDHLTTFGLDLLWRPEALWLLDRRGGRPPRRILDLGCGPGDLTFELCRHFPHASVVGMDFTPAMVDRARRRTGPWPSPSFGLADAQALPFKDATFDLVTSAFLIRNLPRLRDGLGEMRRVLRPGGSLLALEVGEPPSLWFSRLFHAYFDRVVPKVGRLFGTEAPYRYLSTSLRSVPPRGTILQMLQELGFLEGSDHLLAGGIVSTFLARAPG